MNDKMTKWGLRRSIARLEDIIAERDAYIEQLERQVHDLEDLFQQQRKAYKDLLDGTQR